MTKEQEAQQAQTIAEIRDRVDDCYDNVDDDLAIENDIVSLLEIVDSRDQKIADLNRVGANTLMALIESQEKIAKQAKEIERLKILARKTIGDEPDAYKRQTNPHNAYEVIP